MYLAGSESCGVLKGLHHSPLLFVYLHLHVLSVDLRSHQQKVQYAARALCVSAAGDPPGRAAGGGSHEARR